MTEINISGPILLWAQRRSGRDEIDIRERFSDWNDWIAERRRPSFLDLEKISSYTRVPLGYFFLPDPPKEDLPIPDFRAGRGAVQVASADLLETIYLNQRRQAWYDDYLVDYGPLETLEFVSSAGNMSSLETAHLMTEALDYSVSSRAHMRSVSHARSYLISAFENLGGLVVVNSMVANNSQRMLSLEEFRGFTLASNTAPLIFVNGNDTKNGQVFSLLHEFAHVWRGKSGVSQGGDPLLNRDTEIEHWCDEVAAEIAVPATDLQEHFIHTAELTNELDRLAKRYLCSSLVILIRLRSTGLIPTDNFRKIYTAEVTRLRNNNSSRAKSTKGNFYNNQPFRIGRKLSRAIIRETKVGNTSLTEALRLLEFGRIPMFDTYANYLGAN